MTDLDDIDAPEDLQDPPNSDSLSESALHDPLFSGMPCLIRLTSGQEVMAVAYVTNDHFFQRNGWSQFLLECPLIILSNPLRVVRWVPLSQDSVFSINKTEIMFMAQLIPSMINAYMTWAGKMYGEAGPEEPSGEELEQLHQMPTNVPLTAEQDKAVEKLLHGFVATGKPN